MQDLNRLFIFIIFSVVTSQSKPSFMTIPFWSLHRLYASFTSEKQKKKKQKQEFRYKTCSSSILLSRSRSRCADHIYVYTKELSNLILSSGNKQPTTLFQLLENLHLFVYFFSSSLLCIVFN